jgi:lipoprotein-anchoring transpeptidase ErfK/SrfK
LTAAGLLLGTRGAVASSEHPAPVQARSELDRFRAQTDEYSLVPTQFLPQVVRYDSEEAPGTVIIDTDQRYLYLLLAPGVAKRYGVAVGRAGFAWAGTASIGRKTKWPMWFPPPEMRARDREARRWRYGMPGGTRNPLGARALYLFKGTRDTLFRIHGTREPKSIGKAVSSGCIRMLNADVSELYEVLPLGTKVVVLASRATLAQARPRTRTTQVRPRTRTTSERPRTKSRRKTVLATFKQREEPPAALKWSPEWHRERRRQWRLRWERRRQERRDRRRSFFDFFANRVDGTGAGNKN